MRVDLLLYCRGREEDIIVSESAAQRRRRWKEMGRKEGGVERSYAANIKRRKRKTL